MKKLLVSMLALLTFTSLSLAVMTISYVQQDAAVGEPVDVIGCVTALTGAGAGGIFIQDAEAPWSGIQVYGDNTGIVVGMEVHVFGEKEEYYDWTEILIDAVATDVVILGEGCVVMPLVLPAAEGFTEPYEGVLCTYLNVVCTGELDGYNQWTFNDGTGDGMVDDVIDYGNPYPVILGHCYNVTGIMYYGYGAYKACPRFLDEIPCPTEVQPSSWNLAANYPNPFNPTTTIDFSLAEPCLVNLSVYSLTGQQVASLVNSDLPAGEHSVVFDGSGLTSGIYFYTMQAGDYSDSKKMVLIK